MYFIKRIITSCCSGLTKPFFKKIPMSALMKLLCVILMLHVRTLKEVLTVHVI